MLVSLLFIGIALFDEAETTTELYYMGIGVIVVLILFYLIIKKINSFFIIGFVGLTIANMSKISIISQITSIFVSMCLWTNIGHLISKALHEWCKK